MAGNDDGAVEFILEKPKEAPANVPRRVGCRTPEVEVFILRSGATTVETTVAYNVHVAGNWIRQIQRHPSSRRTPLSASLLCIHGLLPSRKHYDFTQPKGPTANPGHPSNPICAIALCVGGSHCLIVNHRAHLYHYETFTFPKNHPLCVFLADKKLRVAGPGLPAQAQQLEMEWAVQVNRPLDLHEVVARAHGKDEVWVSKKKKGKVVTEAIGVEHMAALALGGMRVNERPASLLAPSNCNWGYHLVSEELIKYTARDAYLCYEIGFKCLEKTGSST
ncbi:uncharacterized protein LOC122048946 [Zingiber officinale]|uniref:uncharacterized protein LOC122048946 n=1 Tax=Zingiber officinale TaxID=94328 RepID=UPI001C4CA128|nr:uncharacterized protein LOC122048946 [Zingiber officinale]